MTGAFLGSTITAKVKTLISDDLKILIKIYFKMAAFLAHVTLSFQKD